MSVTVQELSPQVIDFEAIRQLGHADMALVDEVIRARLKSDVVLVNQVSEYIIRSGGKRLRPLVTVLTARACGYTGQGGDHSLLSAIIEFIHTATLLHDDVVDKSELRRGQDTANAVWGNAASVLVGDFLYSRSFEMMVELDSMKVMDVLAHTTNIIAEGEVMQLMNIHDADTTEQRYREIIYCKTARLFEAATRLAAYVAGCTDTTQEALAAYGKHLGLAFQMIDDALDYRSTSYELGKNIGDDLAEGKPTLPLIQVLRTGNSLQKALVREAIEQGGRDRIKAVIKAISDVDGIAYTVDAARTESEKAVGYLEKLPESKFKDALVGLAQFAVERNH